MARRKHVSDEPETKTETKVSESNYPEQPVGEGEKAAQKAEEERIEAAQKEADRRNDLAKQQQEFNKQAYEASIEGQELPPSVQAEQEG